MAIWKDICRKSLNKMYNPYDYYGFYNNTTEKQEIKKMFTKEEIESLIKKHTRELEDLNDSKDYYVRDICQTSKHLANVTEKIDELENILEKLTLSIKEEKKD
jgi:hypothetical protein